MTADNDQTKPAAPHSIFLRSPGIRSSTTAGKDATAGTGAMRGKPRPGSRAPEVPERREKKERRRRIDPTTFEKQYTDEEMEFMNAMQRFKELSGKTFPSHGDVLKVAIMLGYRRATFEFDLPPVGDDGAEPNIILASRDHN